MKNKIDKSKLMKLAHDINSTQKHFPTSLSKAWRIMKATVNCRAKHWIMNGMERIYLRDGSIQLGYINQINKARNYSYANRKNEYTEYLIWLQRWPEIFTWLD